MELRDKEKREYNSKVIRYVFPGKMTLSKEILVGRER